MSRHKSDNTPHDILTTGDRTLREIVYGKSSRSVISESLVRSVHLSKRLRCRPSPTKKSRSI